MNTEITYRWLSPSEFPLIDPLFESYGWIKLNEHTSRVRVAESDGKIIGLLTMQFLPSVGPMHLDPEYRGQGIAQELGQQVRDFMREVECRGYIAIADSPHTVQLCEQLGMSRVDSPVFAMIPEVEKEG